MRTVLFICTGNTCRSPMAMCVARTYPKISAFSRGIFAADGMPMSENAQKALVAVNISLPPHKSRMLRKEDVLRADLILVMTEAQLNEVKDKYPEVAGKTFMLNPGKDLDDPIGEEVKPYLDCLEKIRKWIGPWLV